jgi:hypothetical protein
MMILGYLRCAACHCKLHGWQTSSTTERYYCTTCFNAANHKAALAKQSKEPAKKPPD